MNADALMLEGPIGRETAPMARALGTLQPDEPSADFEPEHLNVLAWVFVQYEWRDPGVYAELQAEVTRLQMN